MLALKDVRDLGAIFSLTFQVNWLFFVKCSQVPVNIDIDTSDPSNITEEVRLKAQELRCDFAIPFW